MATGSLIEQCRPSCRVDAGRCGSRGTLLRILIALVISLGLAGSAVYARAGSPDPEVANIPVNCAREAWQNATDHVWFYDAAGGLVIPRVNYAWLVVHFREDPSAEEETDAELPPAIHRLTTLFQKEIVDVVYDPALNPQLCMYRLRNPEKSGLVAAEMARAEGGRLVHHLRPAYDIGDTAFALLDEIDIRWKTQASARDKVALLGKAGVIADEEAADGYQRVRSDPCRISTWATANLLHEDLQVVAAAPVLAKIEPPVRAEFRVGINGATVGAPVPFVLEIVFSERIRIEPSTIANLNLCPLELYRNLFRVEYARPLSSVDVTKSPIRIEGSLYLYGTGEFAFPEVPVYYQQAGAEATELVMLRTPEVPIRIASVIPEAAGRYQLKVADVKADGLEVQGGDLRGSKRLVLGLSALGAALLVACLIGLRRLSSAARAPLTPEPGADAGVEHAVALRGFLTAGRDTLDDAEIAAFGRAFRGYLGARCQLPAESLGGGAAVFFAAASHGLPPDIRAAVHDVLELIDNRLSRGELRQDEIERMFELARSVLRRFENNGSA
jgi:hypothetical protein